MSRNQLKLTGQARQPVLFESLESRQFLSASLESVLVAPPSTGGTVVAPPTVSSNGVTIHECAGVKFTARLGTFNAIAPADNLVASISWGDGTKTYVKPTAIKGVGVDVIEFAVIGTHTYPGGFLPRAYPIHIVVSKPSPTPAAKSFIVAKIDDTAIVTPNVLVIDGTATGTYALAPTAATDIGARYVFNGSGKLGDVGEAKLTGLVTLPGFIANGHAAGTLTLSNSKGTVTLKVTGPAEKAFSPFPTSLSFEITGGTGAYADYLGGGNIAVKLGAKQAFSFQFATIVPL